MRRPSSGLAWALALWAFCLFAHTALGRQHNFNVKEEFKRVGIFECSQPEVGIQRPLGYYREDGYPTPDWENMYSKLDVQTRRIYEVVGQNPKEMHIQNLYSEGLRVGDSTHNTDIDLVVYERGGLSTDTLQAVNSIGSDQVVEEWLRENNLEDWRENNERARPIPRKRPTDGKLRVVFIFGEHGRELISTEIGEYFVKLLSEASVETLMPIFEDRTFVDDVLAALDEAVIHIVPCENKSGRRIVETPDDEDTYPRTYQLMNKTTHSKYPSNICHRPNSRGVDPNRNWPVKWGNKPLDYQAEQEFGGPAPLSEPEPRLLFRVYKSVEPISTVNVHSGMHGIFMPPDFSPLMENEVDLLAQVKLQDRLNDRWMDGKSTVGAAGYAVGYVAYGSHNDFVRTGFGVPSTQTWEIAGNWFTQFQNCMETYNPILGDELKEYVRNWTGMALEHITHLHKGLIPGIRSPPNEFSKEVAEIPNPRVCGITQAHVDAMNGLGDIAFGRGDRAERFAFVEEAMRRTPTIVMPTLNSPVSTTPSAAIGTATPPALQTGGKDTAGQLGVNDRLFIGTTKAKVPSTYSLMMGSYTIMIFGLLFVTLSFYTYRRVSLGRTGRRGGRPRRYRVWDVV